MPYEKAYFKPYLHNKQNACYNFDVHEYLLDLLCTTMLLY